MFKLVSAIIMVTSTFCFGDVKTFAVNGLEIGLNSTNGGIVSLNYDGCGAILENQGQGALLDMAYPVAEYVPLRISSRYSVAEISEHDGVVEIRYDQMGSDRPKLGYPQGKVTAVIKIAPCSDGRSISMSCCVENNSSENIGQILFPDLDGLQPIDSKAQTRLKMARGEVFPFLQKPEPETEGSASFYAICSGWKCYPAKSFSYGPNFMRWLDYGSLKGGFSLFQKKWRQGERPDIWTYLSQTNNNCLRLCWEHKNEDGKSAAIEPGQTWQSGDFILTPHTGGWAKGIEPYRAYVQQVNPKPAYELPKHIKEDLGFQSVWMLENFETDPSRAYFKFTDIPAIAADAKEHGLREVVLWGPMAPYFKLPFRADPRLGTEEEFIQGIKAAKSLGVNISPFVSIQVIHRDYMERYGETEAPSKWTYNANLIPPFNPDYAESFALSGATIDPNNLLWQKDVEDAFMYWFDKGVYSFSWDVFGLHRIAEGKKQHLELITKLRKIAKNNDPQSTFAAEIVANAGIEWDGQVLDYTWNWTGDGSWIYNGVFTLKYASYIDCGPILNVLKAPRLNCNVESYDAAKQVFADGLFLNVMPRKPGQANASALISECPELSKTIKMLAARRKQFLSYFTEGLFIGDSVLASPTEFFVRGHLLGNKLLIICINPQEKKASQKVSFALNQWLKDGKYNLSTFNESGDKIKRASVTIADKEYSTRIKLNPEEMLFIVVEPKGK